MVTVEVLLKKSIQFSSLWTFMFCSVWFWTPAQGQYRLIGSDQPIVAAPGDDVILPCRVDPDRNMEDSTVEWSRPDPQTLVFLYRFRKEDRDMMMESYIHRASLSADGLKHGDASLRIRNVTRDDTGRFRCFIPNLRREARVLLSVDPNFRTSTTETPQLDRNPGTSEPQNKSSGDVSARRSRILLLPGCFFFFFICLGAVFTFCVRNGFKNKTLQQTPLTQATLLQSSCLAQQTRVSEDSLLLSVCSEIPTSNHTEALRPSGTIRLSHG